MWRLAQDLAAVGASASPSPPSARCRLLRAEGSFTALCDTTSPDIPRHSSTQGRQRRKRAQLRAQSLAQAHLTRHLVHPLAHSPRAPRYRLPGQARMTSSALFVYPAETVHPQMHQARQSTALAESAHFRGVGLRGVTHAPVSSAARGRMAASDTPGLVEHRHSGRVALRALPRTQILHTHASTPHYISTREGATQATRGALAADSATLDWVSRLTESILTCRPQADACLGSRGVADRPAQPRPRYNAAGPRCGGRSSITRRCVSIPWKGEGERAQNAFFPARCAPFVPVRVLANHISSTGKEPWGAPDSARVVDASVLYPSRLTPRSAKRKPRIASDAPGYIPQQYATREAWDTSFPDNTRVISDSPTLPSPLCSLGTEGGHRYPHPRGAPCSQLTLVMGQIILKCGVSAVAVLPAPADQYRADALPLGPGGAAKGAQDAFTVPSLLRIIRVDLELVIIVIQKNHGARYSPSSRCRCSPKLRPSIRRPPGLEQLKGDRMVFPDDDVTSIPVADDNHTRCPSHVGFDRLTVRGDTAAVERKIDIDIAADWPDVRMAWRALSPSTRWTISGSPLPLLASVYSVMTAATATSI
ncbi:hypothetical protein FB451DRAFT_1396684 [Mycena latifolia]|nr:hypothetical protein FB451DRAFT_1396684 [Mycena latifolia]